MKCPKCGWENTPESKQCLQCGALLNGQVDIPLYPPRAKKRSKFTQVKGTKRLYGNVKIITDSFRFLVRYIQQIVNYVSQVVLVNLKILLILTAGCIPGLIQILQRRHSHGLLLLSYALLLSLLFLVFITNIASNFILYLFIALILYSSYDAVTNYYQKKNYVLNFIARARIILSEVSLCFLIYFLVLFVINILYIRIKIQTNYLEPTFKKGDEIIVYRMAYKKELPQRRDIVAAKYGSKTTIERIIGIPGDEVSIKEGKIFLNGNEISNTEGPLVQVGKITATITLPDSFYFLFAYISYDNKRFELVKFHLRDILGKPIMIINPPERRRVIQ